MGKVLFWVTGLLLMAVEIFRLYFIMPFPGSQHSDTIAFAYWLNSHVGWIRNVGLLVIVGVIIGMFSRNSGSEPTVTRRQFIAGIVFLFLYGLVFYVANFKFEADKMFYQPDRARFLPPSVPVVEGNRLIIGVALNGEAKAYPIEIIGYHHQIRDTIGRLPVMITYCTVCRTGRVYSPLVNGKPASFRLVGMDHFNAMFEDKTTGSWWRQATGEAIAGSEKGNHLTEIASQQVTLASWLKEYPQSTVLQPDPRYAEKYKGLEGYDYGTIAGQLEGTDRGSWQKKSWVIGVIHDSDAKAYDWNALKSKGILQDSLRSLPLVLVIEKDTASFHVFDRRVAGTTLLFERVDSTGGLTDKNTGSSWTDYGKCVSGPLMGQQLVQIPAYQEFWHSWKTFHPGTMGGD